MGNLVSKQGLKKHTKPLHCILCKHASKTVETCKVCTRACFAFVVKLRKLKVEGGKEKSHARCKLTAYFPFVKVLTSEIHLWSNVCLNAHLHLFERACVCVCVYVHQSCDTHITLERIRWPYFQFRSISARISVIPLKSCSSPTVTSHNGTNSRVVGAPSYDSQDPFGARPQSHPTCLYADRAPSEENTDLPALR